MPAKFRVKVSADKLSATLLVGRPSEDYVVTLEEILTALEDEGIKYGINMERLEQAVELQSFLSEILCAEGTPQVPGKSGSIKFVVPINHELKPKIREDGTTDYFDLGLINEIDEGRLLCRRTMPSPGVDGTDVYGNVIPFTRGIYPDFPMGEGTRISAMDSTKLVAANNGYITFEDGKICVPTVFKLDSDVGVKTGKIKFRGDVIINGSVREGYSVVSGGNIIINGSVEGAKIFAKESVTISDGFTGMSEGQIFAGGDIKCRFMQNVVAKCNGKIETEYALHSTLICKDGIFARNGKGTIVGGLVHTCGPIEAKDIGADTYVETKVIVDRLPKGFWAPNYIPAEVDADSDVEIEYIEMNPKSKVVAENCAFPGVIIQIGLQFFEVSNELKYTKFVTENGEISATPIF